MTINAQQFTSYLKCPKKAWLSQHKNELAKPNPEAELHQKQLEEVKTVAHDYFGTWADGGKDVKRTLSLLQKGEEVIADASFAYEELRGDVDLLRKTEEGYEAYIVKASTNEHDLPLEKGAFLFYLLQKAGIAVAGIYVLHLNADYRRHGALDLEKLFVRKRLDDHKRFPSLLSSMEDNLSSLGKELNLQDEPKTVFCPHCKRECPFFGHCTENLPSPNVFDLSGFKGRHPFANNGILTFEEIDKIVWREGLALSKLQRAQLDAYLDKEEDGLIIDHKAIKEFVDKLSFPLYHLDFETVLIAIPRFEGARPNESMPTQYSLHIEDGYGGLEHKEFLGDSEDTRRAIAESLCENIPADACVLAYNKAFECSRLKELAEVFPDLSDHLLAIRGNIIDLMAPFENGDYYDIAMKGSYSIKSVLPALYPNDPELDYGALDLVHHGGEAMEAYPKMLKAAPEEKEALRKALLAYCKLDTLAMVKVLQKLKDVIWFDRDSNIWNERKWAKQRSERGFSDNDVFDIPRWFGSIMPKMLEEFLKSNKRIPLRFYEEYYDLHEKELSQYGKRDFINLYYAPGNPRYDPLRQAEKDKMEAWAAAKWDETIQEMIRLFREGENGWGCPWKELEDRAPHIAKWQKKALAMLAEYINELWW